jgi:hypothetical protein
VPSGRRSRAITSACFEARRRLRVGQCFDRRPQLIDQCCAIADLAPLFDIGQRIPQPQQVLAAEPGRAQFRVGREDNLVVTDRGRRLAADGDPIIAKNVDAHGWSPCLPRHNADGDHTHALFRTPSTGFTMTMWLCLTHAEHAIARERPPAIDQPPCRAIRIIGTH